MGWTKFLSGRILGRALGTVGLSASLLFSSGCAAVYPEMKTAVRAPQEGARPQPPPADDLFFLYFAGVTVPPKDQGGRDWPGGTPDPYAKILVDNHVIMMTPVEPGTREPTWPKQVKQNYKINPNSTVVVEVWDDNAMTDMPICHAKIRSLLNLRDGTASEIWCDSGARVQLFVGEAQPLVGVGLYYETRGRDGVRVTRVVGDSPAARAGLGEGDRILAIQGKPVAAMDALQIRSAINEHARDGLNLDVWFMSGKRHVIQLREGALYPLADDDVKLSQ
jgi:hypothetical protein